MALRTNHYDAAFEAYLRERRIPYVAVDESRRSLLEQASLKSMDFIVYSRRHCNLLVDVKGRRFGGDGPTRSRWESWATEDDIDSLRAWEKVFGPSFRAVLVFAYHVVDPDAEEFAEDFEAVFAYRDRRYVFYGVWVDEYQAAMKTRSPSWETVWVPSGDYRRLRSPIRQFLE